MSLLIMAASASLLVILSVIAVLTWLVVQQNKKIAQIEQQQNELAMLLDNTRHSFQNSDEKVDQQTAQQEQQLIKQQNLETLASLRAAENNIQNLASSLTNLQNDVEALRNQQPEDKLYSRALKLASLGADLDEISQSCEIPLAEAEMLLAVHQNKVRSK
jgi:predicted PurR-regulated permease PerM